MLDELLKPETPSVNAMMPAEQKIQSLVVSHTKRPPPISILSVKSQTVVTHTNMIGTRVTGYCGARLSEL